MTQDSPGVGGLVYGAVEGQLDAAVLRRLVVHAGGETVAVYGSKGKGYLAKKIGAYNNAARRTKWLVLVDLDRDCDCAPPFAQSLLPQPAAGMCLRVAVREVEAWLLADRSGLASFLEVDQALVPTDPEEEADPKRVVVRIAERSASRDIRRDMVPGSGSARSEGPAYVSRLSEFVAGRWKPERAAEHSDSLARCLKRLRELVRR
jgi:hypothetical protein